MWARKATRTCYGEDDGIPTEVEYVHLEESWYEILGEGFCGFCLGLSLMLMCFVVTPVMAIRQAYRQIRYADCPVPANEVRERAHLG